MARGQDPVRSSRCKDCFFYKTTTLRNREQLEAYLTKTGGETSGSYNVIRRNFEKRGNLKVYRCEHNFERAYISIPSGEKKGCPKYKW